MHEEGFENEPKDPTPVRGQSYDMSPVRDKIGLPPPNPIPIPDLEIPPPQTAVGHRPAHTTLDYWDRVHPAAVALGVKVTSIPVVVQSMDAQQVVTQPAISAKE
ncbi:hypothetical protein FXO37_20675 [Capsicum annuum]|nr:hypothetical protein FXO37_20675 [Capsicum annuum]